MIGTFTAEKLLAVISNMDISEQSSSRLSAPRPMPRSHANVTVPLRQAVYHILLALNAEERHGLGIADEIERISGGALELGPGTLYRSLAEMMEERLIAPVPPPDPDSDPRRKHYRITSKGRELLVRETARLRRLIDTARAQGILAEQE
jgi:DNA-binding PadR family transcriptional regulator